jgi:GPH family glycoside/pentoside/hexuronide:cation symporter
MLKSKNNLTLPKFIERFSYGCGDFGCNIIYTAMSAFLMLYYTDYAGVSAIAVGTIMMVSRIFDGISDVIMGVIVDRTKSRFGKARPWLLRMCVPFAISGVLLFSVPTSWAQTPKLVYVFITYNLVSTIIFTAINVPYSALNALMTQDPYERSVLSVFRNLLATAGTLTINLTTLPLVEYFGDNASAWTKTFCVLGLLAVAAFLINFFGTKERVKPAGAENGEIRNVPFMVGIKALFQNKYWIMVTMMLVFDFLMYSINSGATVYYAKDVLGNKNFVGTINGISNTVQIAGMFFISGGELSLIIASSVLKGLGYSCGGATMWAMVSDTIDYGEWKTGVRTEGLVNSACSFGYKIGNGVGSVLLGVILEMGGYVGEAVSQTASALTSIRICFIWIPVAAYIAQLIIMKFYNLDKEFNGVIEELKKRNHTEEA